MGNSVFEEWQEYVKEKQIKERNFNLESVIQNSKSKIVSITGVRRCGKTSLLILLYQKILKNQKNQKIAYINLEDNRIKENKNPLDEILKWFGDEGYLILDEITSIPGWEDWLSRIHEMLKGKLKIIVSSSRGSLIKPKRSLRGRIFHYELYPLSFKEFLDFKNIKLKNTLPGKGEIEKQLKEYLVYGGYPELINFKKEIEKIRLISSYFRDIVGLDIVEISGESLSLVEVFGKYIIDSPYFSASKCLNFFKSMGHKIGKKAILDLEKISQDSYLFFFNSLYSRAIKNQSQYSRKAYLGDTGFMNAIIGKKRFGRLFENLVFLELKRRLNFSQEINYWKNSKGDECDFLIKKGLKPNELIQVVYEISDEKIKKREISGIVSCAKEFNLKKGLIITKDFESKEIKGGIKITFMPLWKWLLDINVK
jgi:predicted AAA+ superfamily ATPase